MPLRSANDLTCRRCLAETSSTSPGAWLNWTTDSIDLALGLQIDGVVVEADDALDRAGEHRVLGFDAGRLAEQLDIEPLRP